MEDARVMAVRSKLWTTDFSGLIVACLTPMGEDTGLDLAAVDPYVEFLLERGADALMVLGTTGEFIALSPEEREQVQRRFLRAVGGRVPVVVHAGHVDLRIAERLAAAAIEAGADAIASITPYYHHFTPSAIEDHQRALVKAFPETPFFVYNYPAAAGKEISFGSFQRLLEYPNVCGVKLSVATWAEVEPFLESPPDVLVTCGTDPFLERFLGAGGRAVVSGNAAAFPEVLKLGMAAFRSQNQPAMALARRAGEDLATLSLAGAPDRLKRAIAARKVGVWGSRVRTYTSADASPIGDEVKRLEALVEELQAVLGTESSTTAAGSRP